MLAAFLAYSFLHQNIQSLELKNGSFVTVGEDTYRYWGAADTYLDSTLPTDNFGYSHVLEGGPGRTILIKFGDLERIARRPVKVKKATLYLTPSMEAPAQLSNIRRLVVPWGEGPLRRPVFSEKADRAATWSATYHDRRAGSDPIPWQLSGASGFSDSEVIKGAKLAEKDGQVEISGLEDAAQTMLDRWYENHGFAISFAAPVEFFSSKSAINKPRLVLELENLEPRPGADLSVTLIEMKSSEVLSKEKPWPQDGAAVTCVAHVKNLGDAPANGFAASWSVRERPSASFDVAKTLAPGDETTVELKRTFKANHTDHRLQPLGFRITPKTRDANRSNDYLEIQESAIPVTASLAGSRAEDVAQQRIRILNEVLLARSKFSFAPEGSLERFRIAGFSKGEKTMEVPAVLNEAGLVSYAAMNPKVMAVEGKAVARDSRDRYPGLLRGGFTGNDIGVPGELQLPYEPYFNPIFENYEIAPTELLAASDVAALGWGMGQSLAMTKTMSKLPGTVLLRVLDMDGQPLARTEVKLYQSQGGAIPDGPPILQLTTGDNGTTMLPTRQGATGRKDQFGGLEPDGSNGVYLVAASAFGETDYAWLKAWQLSDAYARTRKGAVFTDLRFNLPAEPIDRSVNLAAGKPMTTSGDDAPAKLNELADGVLDKPVDLPNKRDAWIEIDLGKERAVTEIALIGKEFWPRFEIRTFYTGQTQDKSSVFAREMDWDWNLSTRPDPENGTPALAYRGRGRSVRFIRIVCKEAGAKAALAEIVVRGAKAAAP